MSIKKLAKAANNLADAIRYHADAVIDISAKIGESPQTQRAIREFNAGMSESVGRLPITGASHGSVKGKTAPQNVPKYEGKEAPQPLTEAEENFVDPYDAPPKADYTIVTPQPPAVIASDADITVSAEASDPAPPVVEKSDRADTPPPPPAVENDPTANDAPDFSEEMAIDNTNPVDAPGWQTLTVEELDAKTEHTRDDLAEYCEGAPSVETDADGLPWDERIHSGGKTLLVDGTWRLKRGVPDEEYQEVVAELKKLMAIPTPVDNTPPPPPNASVPVPPAPSTTVDNLPAFIKAVTGAQLDKDVVLAAVKNAGLENVMQLGARPDLIAGIAKELGL